MQKRSFSLLLLVLLPVFCGAEITNSFARLKGLLRLENYLCDLLDEYVKESSDAPKVVQDFAKEVRELTTTAIEDVDEYVEHPINAFLLVRRFTRHWTELSTFLTRSKHRANELQRTLLENYQSFPSSKDLYACARAILRIQDAYNLSAQAIADGHIHSQRKSIKFGADECYELGFINSELEYFEQVQEWMGEAWERMSPPYTYSGQLTKVHVLEHLAWAEYQIGLVDEAIAHTKEILDKADPKEKKLIKKAKTNLRYYQKEVVTYPPPSKNDSKKKEREKNLETITYERLCRRDRRKIVEDLEMYEACYYHNDDPSLLLKPVKVELLNFNPDLFLLHDVITDNEVEQIKEIATPLLKSVESTIKTINPVVAARQFATRTRASIRDKDSDLVQRISKRMELITGLSLDPADTDPLQVTHYGLGGHLEPRTDILQDQPDVRLRDDKGDRIASLLFYLSDVDAGGNTIFLDAETIISPRKGDVLFWYNLFKSGQPNYQTKYGACPVIVGSKWVAKKMVYERGQVFRLPCGMNEWE